MGDTRINEPARRRNEAQSKEEDHCLVVYLSITLDNLFAVGSIWSQSVTRRVGQSVSEGSRSVGRMKQVKGLGVRELSQLKQSVTHSKSCQGSQIKQSGSQTSPSHPSSLWSLQVNSFLVIPFYSNPLSAIPSHSKPLSASPNHSKAFQAIRSHSKSL